MSSTNVAALCFEWAAARKQLSRALDAFEIACSTLSALGTQAGALLESAQPDFLLSVETDLPLMRQEAGHIDRSIDTLKKLRNGSAKLVLTNRLPPELLAYIFSIAVDTGRANRARGVHKERRLDFVNVISSVCTYWRHVSLDTPALWADITFTRPGGLNHAALWLDRSRSCPLRLSAQNEECDDRARDLVELFGRHSSRLQSLVLRSDYIIGQKIFYDACVQHTEGSVHLECLAVDAGIRTFASGSKEMKWPPKDQLDRYLKSVRTLYVRYRLFDDWTSTAFHDLTSLSFHMIPREYLPTCEQLLAVLDASPRLRSLELSDLHIQTVPQHSVTLVNLESLEVVWLESLSLKFAQWLLQSIIPHSDGLTLTLSDIWSCEHQKSIGFNLPFSIPNEVKSLYILSEYRTACEVDLSGLLKSLTRLETLALKSFRISPIDSASNPSDSPSPILAGLDLVSCEVADVHMFKSMLTWHSVGRLRLFECKGFPTSGELIAALPGLVISNKPGDFLTMFSPFN